MSDTRDLIPVGLQPIKSAKPLFARFFCLFYLLGSLIGSLYFHFIGFSASFGQVSFVGLTPENFLRSFFFASFPFFLVLFLSTSVIGYYILPFVYISRGFSFSLCVASLLDSSLPKLRAFAVIGFPAFFSLCALFLLGEYAFLSAWSLRTKRSNEDAALSGKIFPGFLLILVSAVCRACLIIDF